MWLAAGVEVDDDAHWDTLQKILQAEADWDALDVDKARLYEKKDLVSVFRAFNVWHIWWRLTWLPLQQASDWEAGQEGFRRSRTIERVSLGS